jgi:molecular chaperone DnaK
VLGGNDFDEVIVRWLIRQHVGNGGTDPSKNPMLLSRLFEAAEVAKKDLSVNLKTSISIPLFEGPLSIEVELSRGKFESLASKLLARLLKPVREVAIMSGINLAGESGQIGYVDEVENDVAENEMSDMSSAAMRKAHLRGRHEAKEKRKMKATVNKETRRLQKELSDPSITSFPGGRILDDVILVGGATRIPCVQRLIRMVTGMAPKNSVVNPDEAVSLGAAVLAGIMDGDITGTVL